MAVSLEDTIKRRLRAVPDSPGVYMFRDKKTQVIYVGKALRLRDRLRSYFTPGYADTGHIAEMMQRATDFEFVTTANEVEALVLENNLIKNYRPRFNIRLKDDKNYLYLKLPVTEEFPRVHYSRRVLNDGRSGRARTRSSSRERFASTSTSSGVRVRASAASARRTTRRGSTRSRCSWRDVPTYWSASSRTGWSPRRTASISRTQLDIGTSCTRSSGSQIARRS